MFPNTDIEKVRRRAYEIWQAQGCPHGKDREHWLQAEAECTKAARPAPRKAPAHRVAKPASRKRG